MARLVLSAIGLRHFRSHRRADIDADGGPVAIYGPNGAGKTSILEAISLLSPGRGLRRAGSDEIVQRPGGPGWKVTAALEAPEGLHEIETWVEGGGSRQVRIDGKAASQVALGRIARVLWLVPAMDRLWIEAAEGRRRFLDRMVLSFEPGHAQVALDYEKAMRERNRLIRDEVRDAGWYDALEAQMAASGAQLTASRRDTLRLLSAAQDASDTLFPAADLELTHPDTELPDTEDMLRAALAQGRARDMAAGRALLGPHRADLAGVYATKGIAARDCSTGEQKALLVSLILANARALRERDGVPPILLLDEVAAHLDAARRAALYDALQALGVQAWMTGTGRELFAELEDRAQFLEVTESDGVSRVSPA